MSNSDKQTVNKKESIKKTVADIIVLIENKKIFFQDVIQKTILHIQKNKVLDIIGASEVNNSVKILFDLSKKIKEIDEIKGNVKTDTIINTLQLINNDLSTLFKQLGTETFEDLLWVCFGNNSVNTYTVSEMDKNKFELFKKYFHPTSYKLLGSSTNTKKNDNEKNNKTDDIALNDKSKNLDCLDVSIRTKSFHMKIHGLQIIVHNQQHNKSLVITGFVDDIFIDILNNKFITLKTNTIKNNKPHLTDFQSDGFLKFLNSLNLKDYLINEHHQIYSKYVGYLTNLNSLRQKPISQIVKDFVSSDIFVKRNILIQLLVRSDKYDNQYLAYLLYDLLSNDTNGTIDTKEQTIIFDSFPWFIKQYFKDAMNQTIQYTNSLANFDIHKIPLEQQICLLKVDDSVKEKAIQKLKEVKAKSDDSGSKARQYLDGLLKIPFSIYKKEPILNSISEIVIDYINLLEMNKDDTNKINNSIKDNYTSLEVLKSIEEIKKQINVSDYDYNIITNKIGKLNRSELVFIICKINENIKKNNVSFTNITYLNKKKTLLVNEIISFINFLKSNKDILHKLFEEISTVNFVVTKNHSNKTNLSVPIQKIEAKFENIKNYMVGLKSVLDSTVHGHDKAKAQIERIIGQWINGKQDGYCFGFEGPPGVGKTSLAKKGLAYCLKDENNISRPFFMIQMGGDSNGSSLHGHNYTYVGSTWGSIVQILIDSKCMNPIIFIDEIDKISKTEHGKEIVGILTHLLDSTQNDCFQDKYYSGINLDLSKALFILSYNDPDAIDKILLDRIHRVKFKNLSLDEKMVISSSHILPEVYNKMGLENMIYFSNEVLKFIIEEYTSEPGVRKLKEILFEIVSEINLNILKSLSINYMIPINITIEDVKNKYFKDKHEIKNKVIHTKNKVGIINGLWANAMGKGGVIPIQAKWCPSKNFMELKLTGLQGDVMKESMNVALTLAWNLTPKEQKEEIINNITTNLSGIHVHCPEGAMPKDGPSAGTAITTCLFSLFNKRDIMFDIAITGEITLDGDVTEIGGLDLKILGGVKAGVKKFIYPKENQKDFDSFMLKNKDDENLKDISFHNVENIEEVFKIIFEN